MRNTKKTNKKHGGVGGSTSSNASTSGNGRGSTSGNGRASTSGNGIAYGGEDDMFNPAVQVIDELYYTRDNFFSPKPNEKLSKLRKLNRSAVQVLDSIPIDMNSTMQRAMYEYLGGKILDYLPTYNKEAEEFLTRAVKLNPSIADAWLSLGTCRWKKGEKMEAKNCMMQALLMGPSKRIFRELSILERKMAKDNKQDIKAARVCLKQSIIYARKAVAMDVTDGHSWHCLGNALYENFFVTGASDLAELRQSMKAYQNAERDAKMNNNAKLSFNSATVNLFLENYERALSGFEAAASKDPTLDADCQMQNIVRLLDSVDVLGNSPYSAKELDAVKLDPPYKRATLDILKEGVNKAFAIVGKVLVMNPNENPTPHYYSVCDSNYQRYILSVYWSWDDAIKEGDQVTILDPCYRHQDFTWKEKRYVFESLRVNFLEEVLVNGKVCSPK